MLSLLLCLLHVVGHMNDFAQCCRVVYDFKLTQSCCITEGFRMVLLSACLLPERSQYLP